MNSAGDIDYNGLMQANLVRVFGERDPARRIVAIRELYAGDAVLHEPEGSAKGHEAICAAVTALLDRLPPAFGFRAAGPAVGHSGAGRLRWNAGPANGPVVVTGTDFALFEGGLIVALYVFLDPDISA